MPSNDDMFFDGLVKLWKGNKFTASFVFGVTVLLAAITAYSTISEFISKFDRRASILSSFNELTQPIYFQGRTIRLHPGEKEKLDAMAKKIAEIRPRVVLLRSHTSRVNIGINRPITATRGEWLSYQLIKRVTNEIGADNDIKYFVVSYGGRYADETKGEYQQRVEIEVSDVTDMLANEGVMFVLSKWARSK